jgi:hypothetical protein
MFRSCRPNTIRDCRTKEAGELHCNIGWVQKPRRWFHHSAITCIGAKKGSTSDAAFNYAINRFSWKNKQYILLGIAHGNTLSQLHVNEVRF